MDEAWKTRSIVRSRGDVRAPEDDRVVVEEPLEIRVGGDTLAITMRTPGHDRELALGFLWAEGIIGSLSDVAGVAHCGRIGDPGRGNTIEVTAAPGSKLRLGDDPFARRGTLTTSACGVCGRRTIDDLLARSGEVARGGVVGRGVIARGGELLRSTQEVFARTGGCHGAALVTFLGEHVGTFEDVGRHNAVDKLVGAQLLAGKIPAEGHILFVSGRTSFEIVQKAAMAKIPVVVGVSAASSLAVELAERTGISLVGFARGGDFVVYTGAERIG
jgi:FdhD protein